MFFKSEKAKNFFKRQVAKVLSVVMAFSCLASTGLSIATVHAAPNNVVDNGKPFVDKLVEWAVQGTPYKWGGFGPPGPSSWYWNAAEGRYDPHTGFDCRSYINNALIAVYGTNKGYVVDDSGRPVNGTTPTIELAPYDYNSLSPYVGKRLCIEGNGHKAYYRVIYAGVTKNNPNAMDISWGSGQLSSILAEAMKYPGSILGHNGHWATGFGLYNSSEELYQKHPSLRGARGTNYGKTGTIVRWDSSKYYYGNQFPEDSMKYNFGKTTIIHAENTNSGIRVDNMPIYGKNDYATGSSGLCILQCEAEPPTYDVSISKFDADKVTRLGGAVFGIYKDPRCAEQVATVQTDASKPVVVTLKPGTYYIKELIAPDNYKLDTVVRTLEVRSDYNFSMVNSRVDAMVMINKIDAHDNTKKLSDAKFKIQEYDVASDSYKDLVNLDFTSSRNAYTINADYTDSTGKVWKDKALHATAKNNGQFKLVETAAPNGYDNSDLYTEVFNINNGPLIRTGPNSIRNNALLSLVLTKTDDKNNPLANAEFKVEYDGNTYTGTTDSAGKVKFEFPEGDSRICKVTETKAPDGYDNSIWKNGREFALQKDKIVEGHYLTEIKVVNYPTGGSGITPPADQKGTLIIKKEDAANPMLPGVADAKYSVYVDESLQTVLTLPDGSKAEKMATDSKGEIRLTDLAMGTYFIREVEAPYGYAIQDRTFVATLVENDGTEEIVVQPKYIADDKQYVEVSLHKTDKYSGKPIENAVFALYNLEPVISATTNNTIPAMTLLGYYKTDAEGMVTATQFGTEAFTANGEQYEKVTVKDSKGMTAASLLTNGKYYFIEQSAPEGYIVDGLMNHVDASWQANNSNEEIQVEGGVVTANGEVYKPNAIEIENAKQFVEIELKKTDKETNKQHASEQYPALNNYQTAKVNGYAATLDGATYGLYTAEAIKDPMSGSEIPADFLIGVYEMEQAGSFMITEMNTSKYNGTKIPNGKYYLKEMTPPVGYAVDETKIPVDATWKNGSSAATVKVQVTGTDEILRQPLTINKVDYDGNKIDGAVFELYSVPEILEKNGYVKAEDLTCWNKDAAQMNGYYPLKRAEFEKLIENVNPVADSNGKTEFTTKDGTVTTGDFIYSDYILYEKTAPKGYVPGDAIYIRLPWVEEVLNDVVSMSHVMHNQPKDPYTQIVTNKKESEEVSATLKLIKVNAETNEPIVDNKATFELFNGNKKIATLTSDNVGIVFSNDKLPAGTYTLKETKVPDGFFNHNGDITLTITDNGITATTEDGKQLETEWTFAQNGVVATVIVPNHTTKKVSSLDLTIVKVDEKNQPIKNNPAEFTLADGTSNIPNGNKNWMTDENGKFVVSTPLELDKTYTLEEIKSPVGFNKIAQKISITATETEVIAQTEDGKTTLKTDFTNDQKGHVSVVVYVPNTAKPIEPPVEKTNVNLLLMKVDAKDNQTPLKNATFTITKEDGSVLAADVKSDKSGYVNLPGLLEVEQTYYITETKAPEGYDSIGTITLTITQDGAKAMLPDGTTLKVLFEEKGDSIEVGVIVPNVKLAEPNPGPTDPIDPPTEPTDPPTEPTDPPTEPTDPPTEPTDPPQPETPNLVVNKTGTPETWTNSKMPEKGKGDFVTVVKNGDEITYTITVKNTGKGDAHNIVVTDEIPENSTFVKLNDITSNVPAEQNKNNVAEYNEDTGLIRWTIPILKHNEYVQLSFVVKTNSETPNTIVNQASYTSEENPGEKQTEFVVHQVADFHKESTVPGGATAMNATEVAIGNKITYQLTFNAPMDAKNVKFVDTLPNGLTYVLDSVKLNGQPISNGVEYAADTKVLTVQNVNTTGEPAIITFDATVDNFDFDPMEPTKIYKNVASLEVDKNTFTSEEVFHKSSKDLTVTKGASPETFSGSVDKAKDTTSLMKDETVTYDLTVANNGINDMMNIVVTDTVPRGLKLGTITEIEGVQHWTTENENGTITITWLIDKLNAGKGVALSFDTTVEKQESMLIVNAANYGEGVIAPDKIPTIKTPQKTNDVVHNVVEFHKASEVVGGSNKNDATAVSIGDTIKYTLTVKSKDTVKNASIVDPIPNGLKYVADSLVCLADGKPMNNFKVATEENNGNTIVKLVADELPAGTIEISFDAQVQAIPMNTEKFFINQAKLEYNKFQTMSNSEKNTLMSETVSHVTSIKLEGHKNGTVETYVGDYENRHHVSVVANGDTIDYTITVKNSGVSTLHNVKVVDMVPKHTTFVKAENNGKYDEASNGVYWDIETLKPNETAQVKFTVKCNTNEAVEIRNVAYFGAPNGTAELTEKDFVKTEEVIHQTVALKKSASVDFGHDVKTAKHLAIGSVFTYKIQLNALNDIYDVQVSDKIPAGLLFVSGSAAYKMADGQVVKLKDLTPTKENVITFPSMETLPAGITEFTFDVKVRTTKEFDKEIYFINTADATVHENESAEKEIQLTSNPVANKTIRTNNPGDPSLGFNGGNTSTMWASIAVVSAVFMVILGAYGFKDVFKKKKRNK